MRAGLLVAVFLSLGVDDCDPEAMSGDDRGRRMLAERAQQSTRDIQSLRERVDELERQVAALKQSTGMGLPQSDTTATPLDKRITKIEKGLQALDSYMRKSGQVEAPEPRRGR